MRSTSSRRAGGSGSSRWLLVRGRGDRPLDAAIGADQLRAHSSTRRPTVARGDLAVCYASVWQAIFAVVEVTSDPEHDPTRDRWSWRFELRPLSHVADLNAAPPVEAAGVFPQSLWRHSYIRLSPEQFAAGRALVEQASE